MSGCDEYAIKILLHLDSGLKGHELEDVLSHLDVCVRCRAQLEAEVELSATLRRCRPLYFAPIRLRGRVTALTGNPASNPFQASMHRRASRIGANGLSGILQLLSGWRILAPVTVAIVVCLAVVPSIERRVQAASYIETAVAQHRSYIHDGLSPGLESSSPEKVTAWIAGKVPFDFRLPAGRMVPEKNLVCRLTGATLVYFKGSPAALVTYKLQNQKISLLVDSSNYAPVAGGDEVRLGELTLHSYNDSGFRVVTWASHGLSYALVSPLSMPERTSCLVCHQNMADSSNFRTRP
jgi:anti-sigma factor RsiW